ncbi:unnamed protein product [Adineta steineri]|uniref:SET domain-containing protein n=1 Tax=Adineta steineri TaxID=433720 RepID=A0A814HZK7_9BILA|nr:unnamed protein product [Adineta steineri]CAF3690191.1 unnamed protein product [Adineta steineri]
MIKSEKTSINKKEYKYQRKKESTNFGERNIRPRKRVLSDNYLYCDNCKKYNDGLCPRGCQTYEANHKANHAKYTVSSGLKIMKSTIPGAGLGVFTMKEFSKNTFFGPYTGERHRSTERANQSGYAWTIEDDAGDVYNYIDASDPHRSNWLRYVNCPIGQNDENLTAIQFNGEVYYRTLRDINAGEELFVYYGEEYAKALGLDSFDHSIENQTIVQSFLTPHSIVSSKTEQKQQQTTSAKKQKTIKRDTIG